jgi:xanthine dehydrogenase accessory factor
VAKAFQQLRDRGVSEEVIKKIYSPIGISIAANTPAEIAVSIAAELVAVRNGARVSSCTLSDTATKAPAGTACAVT